MAGSELTDPLDPTANTVAYDRNLNLNLSCSSQTIRPFTASTYLSSMLTAGDKGLPDVPKRETNSLCS
jgi:hypothetical protein